MQCQYMEGVHAFWTAHVGSFVVQTLLPQWCQERHIEGLLVAGSMLASNWRCGFNGFFFLFISLFSLFSLVKYKSFISFVFLIQFGPYIFIVTYCCYYFSFIFCRLIFFNFAPHHLISFIFVSNLIPIFLIAIYFILFLI